MDNFFTIGTNLTNNVIFLYFHCWNKIYCGYIYRRTATL